MKLLPRSRIIYAVVILLVIALGVVSRQVWFGNVLWDKYLGDALYAVMLYLGFRLLWPAHGKGRHLIFATAFVLLIEAFQLTGIPANMRLQSSSIQKLISVALGTKFHLFDIIAYLIGNLSAWLIDRNIEE